MITTNSLRMDSRVRIHGGAEMPVLGFGTWKLVGGTCVNAVREAIAAGYRLIDTASMYDNEKEVGEGLRQSGVDRDELFVTTKLWSHEHGYENALKACERSLEKLGLDRLDLYLIHWPAGRNLETWKALIRLRDEGKVRSIGVSNFSLDDIDGLIEATEVTPEVNQVEFNPEDHSDELLAGCRSRGIVMEAYSPLKGTNLGDQRLDGIARNHSKTPAQVIIRWVMQRGAVPLAKSAHPERITENADVFDFSLSSDEMSVIDGLGKS